MTSSRSRLVLRWLILGLAVFYAGITARAEEQAASAEGACLNPTIVSAPSRPTVSNSADPTQCGVVELEYGLGRQWPGRGTNRDDLSGGLRLGLTRDMDFHWSSSVFLHLMDGNGDYTGFGDTWLGLKYRFLQQTRRRPSLAFFYQAKVPSASVVAGLGSGQVDHAPSLLVSKDLHSVHFDFNVTPLFVGRPVGSGFDHNTGFALSAAAHLIGRLSVVGEGYGATALNPEVPAFASTMLGFTYAVQPRIIVDTGLDVGVSHGAPSKRVFVGFTWALANLYSSMRPRK